MSNVVHPDTNKRLRAEEIVAVVPRQRQKVCSVRVYVRLCVCLCVRVCVLCCTVLYEKCIHLWLR